MNDTLIHQAVDPKQYVAWKYLDSKFCYITKMVTRQAPMPWQINEYSKN